MHASTACGSCSRRECPFGDPQGWAGALALTAMALKNGTQNKAALDALAPRRGDSVIEIGCGPGMGVRAALKRVGRQGFVAGIDRSPTAVHFAHHLAHRAVLAGRAAILCSGAERLPFRDDMFDKAFAVNSFQFWREPAKALREIARVLAPEGRLAIAQRASRHERPTDFAGAAGGLERMGQASALLKQLGWRLIDERCVADGARLIAAVVLAERPQ
jgi:SAM-dependent methyltransferase